MSIYIYILHQNKYHTTIVVNIFRHHSNLQDPPKSFYKSTNIQIRQILFFTIWVTEGVSTCTDVIQRKLWMTKYDMNIDAICFKIVCSYAIRSRHRTCWGQLYAESLLFYWFILHNQDICISLSHYYFKYIFFGPSKLFYCQEWYELKLLVYF